jgi:hypothetical protein
MWGSRRSSVCLSRSPPHICQSPQNSPSRPPDTFPLPTNLSAHEQLPFAIVYVVGLKLPVAVPATPNVTALPFALLVAIAVTRIIDPAGAVTAATCTGPSIPPAGAR